MIRHHAWFAAACMVAIPAAAARAQGPIPTPIPRGDTIGLQAVATGLNQPNYLTHAGDGSGRDFIAERDGRIRVLTGGGLAATPFLDISGRVLGGGERGLLGLAFHPGFADPLSSGYRKFYTYTSEAADAPPDFASPAGGPVDHHSVITEWTASAANPAVADPTSRREVLRIAQPQDNHNAGAIAFSPRDGLLHIALGDGGVANDVGPGHTPGVGNGQDPTNVLGDILRIDPLAPSTTPTSPNPVAANGNYRIPATNPFVGSAGAAEIFATGFRNPYRMSFDALDGRLLVGDVGQGNIEEVDIVTLGGNYGWNRKEGSFLFNPATGGISTSPVSIPGLIDPVLQYDHDEGISIIGGFVYRGSALPGLFGRYIFGDLTGRLFQGDLTTGQISELLIGPDNRRLGLSIIGFGEDAQHELYVLATDFSPTGGVVFRIGAVPEPASLLALAAGLPGLVAGRRRWARSRPLPAGPPSDEPV